MSKLLFTRGVSDLVADNEEFAKGVVASMARYNKADWGDLCEEDKKENDKAVKNGDRIVARYNLKPRAIYIITEWDRSATTVLFPEEY